MQAIDIPLIPSQAQSRHTSTNEAIGNYNNTEIGKPSSTSLSASPERPPVSPITPVTPEPPPENIDEEGREALQPGHHDEDIIKANLSKTSNQDHTRCQTKPVPPQIKPKSAPPSAAMPASDPTPVLVPVPAPPTTYIQRPPSPVPISTNSNPDAIALRSAISLLQMQRQRGQKDMQTLEEIKQAALKDPERFVGELVAGRVKSSGPGGRTTGDFLTASLRSVHGGEHQQQQQQQQQQQEQRNGNSESSQKNNNNNMDRIDSDGEDDDEDKNNQKQSKSTSLESKFASVPTPQNIFRCPPINWAKYHVVGESLDKIHAEQIARPPTGDVVSAIASAGEATNIGGTAAQARNPPYVMSAPYSPFQDTIMTAGGKGNRKNTMGEKGGMGNG